ncbi:MAG: chromosomal replication initiator protein DnaA [Candidatus Aquicultorales bacterium]
MEGLTDIWEGALELIQRQLNTPTFRTWFEQTTPLSMEQEVLTISAPNSFAKDWLESRYGGLILNAVREVTGYPVDIRVVVNAPRKTENKRGVGDPCSPRPTPHQPLNLKYTFDSFVIGSSNRFAHAAALAVAEKPSQAYNPLFIYGGVGLGKTHILQAIAHYVQEHYPHLKVRYVSCEKFLNDFVASIREKDKIAGFQRRYRYNDILLVDDIQFLENKEGTQEEFFHTFNTLYEANKQIVLSSDRPPKDIATLEDRLRSRFEWGLITDIQPPDLETRIAILSKKAQAEGLEVPNPVLEFIASKVQSNIRELEGALIRILAFSSLTTSPLTVELASDVLKDIFPDRGSRPIGIQSIIQEVCKYFSISKSQIVSHKRSQSVVYPRQIAMYLSRELTDLSLPRIGEEFGGRDHTTVMYAVSKIEALINNKREAYNQIQELTNRIKQKA